MQKMRNRIFSLLLTVVMLAGMLPMSVQAAGEITRVELTLNAPAIGQPLDFTPTAEGENYAITSVRWLKDWGEHGNMLCDRYHTVEPGEPYTVRIGIYPKEGYSFADLDDVRVTVNGKTDGVTFTYDDLYTGIICSVAFEELGYTVSFDANGGIGTMEQVTDVYPDYTLPDCGFAAPAGMVFNGWTVGDPSGAWYAAGSTMSVNANVTLYAKWADPTDSHKITFVNRTTDPYQTVEIIVSEGEYTLPGIEGIFEIPRGSTFDDWGMYTGGSWKYYDPGTPISVTEDLEIIATWALITYDEQISKAVFALALNSGVEYKHGMLAGSLSVSLGEVNGTFNEGVPVPLSLASGGYGHGYWLASGDMLLGTDALSTTGSYRLYVKFDIPVDRHVLFSPDDFSLSGDLGNIPARSIVSLDGGLVAVFNLPAVSGTPLGTDAVTFTLAGYAIDQPVTAVTVSSGTAHVSLRGSGYGIGNPYMIYEDYVDYDTRVTDPAAKFEKHQDYCIQIDYVLDEGYSFPDSFWDGSNLKKDKFKLAGVENAVVTAVSKTSVAFRLPQLGTTAVDSLVITLNGYEAGKTAWDVSLTAPECMDLPEVDNPTYPPYGRLYCYYDPGYGFGDDDGDFSSIAPGTVLNVGDQYPFTIKFYPVDGYDYSELKKEDITLVTPYGTCKATLFRPGRIGNCYWLTFNLPAIGAIATTPITSVTISDLAKPVIGEMPDNDVTISGTGVTVDAGDCYWGRFDSPSFTPYYDDGNAVAGKPFRAGETYIYALYLKAAAGYEFSAASKFYFAGNLLPALDTADLSKTGAMVDPSDSSRAIVYINMNDITHVHLSGAWDHNDTHHWHICTASGCDAGTDVSRLPDYAEHSFVNGLCACGAHRHSWSAEWSGNATHHWHECSAAGCTITEDSRKDGYAAHGFSTGVCTCGVSDVISSIVISDITAPVAGAMPINRASVDHVGAEVDGSSTFWVRYDPSSGRTRDTYADGTSVYNTPFRDGERYLLQITIKPRSGYRFAATAKLIYGGAELPAPDAANPAASCGAIAPDGSMAMALIHPNGASAPLTYTVSFAANGGSGSMADVTGVSGEYTLPACTITAPSGKQFKAWSVGGAEKAAGETIIVTADTTVTAVWENMPIDYFTVTFDANGGSAVEAQTVADGQKATKPADPVRSGYRFKGWVLDGAAYDFGAAVTDSITLSAVWEAVSVFDDDWYWVLVMLYNRQFDISASADEGGEIDPAGVTMVQYSKSITYTITPDAGYTIKSVMVDGKDVGAVSEYTFKKVTEKHTIHAVFEKVNPYTDVMAEDWFYDDVLCITAAGLMEGTGEERFSPKSTTDRAMLVTVLWRLEGCPVVDSPVDFFDIAGGMWYADAIDWASAYGIINGYGDGRFGPADPITREQIMAIFNRYAAYKGWTDGTAYPMLARFKCSEWAENNVIWAETNGLTEGIGVDVFDMTAKASRAELAAYLHRFLKNIVR